VNLWVDACFYSAEQPHTWMYRKIVNERQLTPLCGQDISSFNEKAARQGNRGHHDSYEAHYEHGASSNAGCPCKAEGCGSPRCAKKVVYREIYPE